MSKLSIDKIQAEVEEKGYKLLDASKYENLSSPIIIQCSKGHKIETSLGEFRKVSFECPVCDKSISFINPNAIPTKKGYRIIALDQATEKLGLSIFEDGKLIFYSPYSFSGVLNSRLVKIAKFFRDIVIKEWKPDFMILEDIQCQRGGMLTYKILSMLLGILEEIADENEIAYDVVSPNVWRKYAGTCGKDRREEKLLSVAKVKEKYGINTTDDAAEAILIGQYGVKTHVETAFGKALN